MALFAATCFANTDLSLYAKPDFETYRPILDRMPFGAPPDPNAAPPGALSAADEKKAQLEKEKLAKQINMSALNITPDGRTAIGFTDLSSKPPANYYLAVGESSDGWTVLDADYDTDTATVEKEGIEITLQLGKGLIEPAAPGGRPPALTPFPNQSAAVAASQMILPAGTATDRPLPPGLRRGGPNATATPSGRQGRPGGAGAPTSYSERLKDRVEVQQVEKEEADRKQKEALASLAAAAAQEAIRKQQREAAEELEAAGFGEDETEDIDE